MGSQLLNKKVLATDNCLEKENQLFPVECHGVYQPYFRAGPTLRISQPQ